LSIIIQNILYFVTLFVVVTAIIIPIGVVIITLMNKIDKRKDEKSATELLSKSHNNRNVE